MTHTDSSRLPDTHQQSSNQRHQKSDPQEQHQVEQPSVESVLAEAKHDPLIDPADEGIARWTDAYFLKSQHIIERFGDSRVTYCLFMRRPVIFAPRIAVEWLESIAHERGDSITIDTRFNEGDFVGAGQPLLYVTGSFRSLVDLETLLLQRIGPCCVAAHNVYHMCMDLPGVEFVAMDARHCAGREMALMMAYAASVGSNRARNEGAKGFIATSVAAPSGFFPRRKAVGSMPHGLIGYAGSTVRAAEMFHETYPDDPLIVLVDYFGREVSDALEVCRRFPDLVASQGVSFRLDTHGSRFVEGLDPSTSYAVLERNSPDTVRDYRTERELAYLVGPGVSAAAVWHLREQLDGAGFQCARILASSGFTPWKCRTFALAQAPVDMIGTGSYLPQQWSETYATADVISYDGERRVKAGREFLFPKEE